MPTPAPPYRVTRLHAGDDALARRLFSTMAAVFDEPHAPLSDAYVAELLARDALWILAATSATPDDVVAGLTAHTLPMTRSETREVFIYDIAVHASHQRRGVGTLLMTHLRSITGDAGIHDLFVPADDEDTHALEFYRALGGVASPVTFFTFGPSR